MTDGGNFSDAYIRALLVVPYTAQAVARELRLMAQAEGPYRRFTYLSPSVRNIWHAAAEMLEARGDSGGD